MRHVAVFVVCVFIILLHIVDKMVATVVGEVECEVLVVDARHLVAVVIDEVGIINEVIQIVCLDNQAVAVESRHVAHLVVAIESVISVKNLSIDSGGSRSEPSCRIISEPISPDISLIACFSGHGSDAAIILRIAWCQPSARRSVVG